MAKMILDELITLIELKSTKDSKRTVSTFRGGLLGIRKVALLAGAAVVTLGAGLGVMVNKVNKSTDAHLKFANSIGVSFEHLQELEFAGKKAGASMQEIDSTLAHLSKTMNPAIPGEYNRELLLLGINSRKSDGSLKTSAAVLLDVAKAIKGMPVNRQNSILESLGFNAGATKLVQQSLSQITKDMKQARSIGGVVSTRDAANAVKYDNAVIALTTTIKGLASVVILSLTPAITKSIQALEKFVLANKGVIATNLGAFIRGVGLGFADFFGVISKVTQGLNMLVTGLFGTHSALASVNVIAAVTVGILTALVAIAISVAWPFIAIGAAITALVLALPSLIRGFKIVASTIKSVLAPVLKFAGDELDRLEQKIKAFSKEGGQSRQKKLRQMAGFSPGNASKFFGALNVSKRAQNLVTGVPQGHVPSQAATTNNVTIHVNGAKDPKAVGAEVKRQMDLSTAVQVAAPGYNRPAVA